MPYFKKNSWASTGKIILLYTSKIRNFKCEKNESVWGAVESSIFHILKRLILQCGTEKLSSSYFKKYFLTLLRVPLVELMLLHLFEERRQIIKKKSPLGAHSKHFST